MNEDVDDEYRRAAAGHPSRPGEAVRRAVLAHAAAVAAERAGHGGADLPARAARRKWLPAVWGTCAAAGLAGLVLLPRLQQPPERAQAARDAPAVTAPSDALQSAALPPAAQSPAAPAPAAPRAAQENLAQRAYRGAAVDAGGALRSAAAAGDLQGLRTLLAAGADADGRDAAGRSALLLAVIAGHTDAVELLLAYGADPNAEDAAGLRPLAAATAARRPALAAALRHAGAH